MQGNDGAIAATTEKGAQEFAQGGATACIRGARCQGVLQGSVAKGYHRLVSEGSVAKIVTEGIAGGSETRGVLEGL